MHDQQDSDGPGQKSPEFYNKLTASVPGIIYTYWLSADGSEHRYPYVSRRVTDWFGLKPEALQKSADVVFGIVHPDDLADVGESIQASARNLTTWKHCARLKLTSGEYQWFEGHSEPERQSDGSTLWYGQFHNIQQYKELEQTLRESEAEYSYQAGFQKLIADLSKEFINLHFGTIDECINELLRKIGEFFGVDRAYLFTFSDNYQFMANTHEWVSPGVSALIDRQKNVYIGGFQWWQQQIHGMVSDNKVVFIPDASELPDIAGGEKELLERRGVCSMFAVPVKVRGHVTGFFGVDSLQKRIWREDQGDLLIIVSGLLSGALERHSLEQKLLSQSIRDPLTGLHNRRYLMPRLEEMLGQAARKHEPFAVAMFDIDHFKQINDSLGHLAGDYVLTEFADILMENTRCMDVVARYGGEEFMVAFALDDTDDVGGMVARILQAVHGHAFVFEDLPIEVTVSAGIAAVTDLPAIPSSPDPVIGKADHHLYLAKEAGRDCFVDASGVFRVP
ncbi:diguanylate cyclase [Marinobacter sp. GN3S48]|uniref:sensor domain-containing diguanylate cyclase n=1 Tax=Marinobacter sp. GN3S48 TaxID=3382302 RepID=UPI00387B4C3E